MNIEPKNNRNECVGLVETLLPPNTVLSRKYLLIDRFLFIARHLHYLQWTTVIVSLCIKCLNSKEMYVDIKYFMYNLVSFYHNLVDISLLYQTVS